MSAAATPEELATRIAWVVTGVVNALRTEDRARRGSYFAARLVEVARAAEAQFRAWGDPEDGGCDVCSDPACYRNQPPANWPEAETTRI